MKKKFCIIDGNNHIMIAISVARNIHESKGMSVEDCTYNLLYSMMRKLKQKFSDHEYFVCFDTRGGTSFRKEIDENYKSNRTYNTDTISTLESSHSVYEDFGVRDMSVSACEADDAMYALAKSLKEKYEGCDVTLVTRDHDLIQCVQAGYADRIYDPSKKKDMDIPFYSIIDYKALVGDSSDCIPGIPGIGEKTAIKIITGMKKLTEEQLQILEKEKDIIDSSRNPRFPELCEIMKERLN